jgi:hypothetical protein
MGYRLQAPPILLHPEPDLRTGSVADKPQLLEIGQRDVQVV